MRKGFIYALTFTVLGLTAYNLWLTRGPGLEFPREAEPVGGKAAIGGDFTLTDQNERTVHAADLHGRLQLVYFGFVSCPDICPTSLLTITNALNSLGAQAQQVQPVFITVDPARDTPAVLKEYMQNFHPSFLGLTGTPEQVAQAAAAYKVYYEKPSAPADKEYVVNHSGFIYLMDRDGSYLTHFSHSDPEQKLLDAIRPHLH